MFPCKRGLWFSVLISLVGLIAARFRAQSEFALRRPLPSAASRPDLLSWQRRRLDPDVRARLIPRQTNSLIRGIRANTTPPEFASQKNPTKVSPTGSKRWWLDTLAKLLHNHPLPFTHRLHTLGRLDSVTNEETATAEDDARTKRFNFKRSSHNHKNTNPFEPPIEEWKRLNLSEEELLRVKREWLAQRLHEQMKVYSAWLSPRQWRQLLILKGYQGDRPAQVNVALFEAAVIGVRRAVTECQHQMRTERWNCTLQPAHSQSLFGNVLLKGIPETAFVYSLINAGVVQAIAEACLSRIETCPCDSMSRRPPEENWKWHGCDHNVLYGQKFARRFLDTMERGQHVRFAMNLHNNNAGRRHVMNNMELYCRCHGTSGSCTMKTCYRKTPNMRVVGALLKERYQSAVKVIRDTAVSELSQENGRRRRRAQRRFRRTRGTHGATGMGLRLANSGFAGGHSQRLHDLLPKPTDLVFYERQKENLFCEPHPDMDILGTHARRCNSSSPAADNCNHLCCGRGFTTQHHYEMESCNCKFVWCCRVECQECLVLKKVETCT